MRLQLHIVQPVFSFNVFVRSCNPNTSSLVFKPLWHSSDDAVV